MKSSFFNSSLSWLIAIILLSLLALPSWAVEISVSVDRNPVSTNESFKIFFDAPDTPDGDPDLSPLDSDFSVLNQAQSSSSSWINGQYSKSIRWTVEAMAKRSGNVQIPAIKFGSDRSKPLSITVSQGGGNDADADANQDLFLQVKAAPEQPYVQSQVIYTVKLYRRVEIAQAALNEPELSDAVVEKLGEDSNYNTVLNGVSFVVTERKYAIFPQKSGKLTIPPLTLNAQVVVDDDPRGFGGFFGSQMTKTKRVLSSEITLNVKPASAKFTGKNWLPAEKLELAETWSGDTQQAKVGEPLTRTLTLRGIGTTVGQLPELNSIKSDAHIKAYPDQPALNEQKAADGISATRQEKIALIPSVADTQTLPAVEIPWFNTTTEKLEIARIPETTISVVGRAPKPINAATPEPSKPQANSEETNKTPEKEATPISVSPPTTTANFWPWLALALGAGWLSTLAYFLYFRRNTTNNDLQDKEALEKAIRISDITKQLKTACDDNDSLGAKTVLLAWGRHEFGASSLAVVANRCDARLRDEILELNRHLYSKDKSEWHGKKLFQAFSENAARKKTDQTKEMVLEPLHRL